MLEYVWPSLVSLFEPTPVACLFGRDQGLQLEYPWAADGLRIEEALSDGLPATKIFDKVSGQLIVQF